MPKVLDKIGQMDDNALARLLGNAEASAYLSHLKSQFKVEIKVKKPNDKSAS